MRRVLSALAATFIGVLWLVTFRVTPLPVDAVAAEPTAGRTQPPSRSAATSTPTRTTAPQTTALPATPVAAGTFTGALVDTRYGPVQVRIVVSGQKVVDIQPVLLPRDRARSAAISQYSAPILRSEAIAAQTSQIDVVSGATYTSVAYARSFESALKQAHLA